MVESCAQLCHDLQRLVSLYAEIEGRYWEETDETVSDSILAIIEKNKTTFNPKYRTENG